MKTTEIESYKTKIIEISEKLELVADSIQEEIVRLDQNNSSSFDSPQETKLKSRESKLRLAIAKLSEAENNLIDALYP